LSLDKTKSSFLTICISDVDKIEADDVISGVAVSRGSLMQAVDVKAGCKDGPNCMQNVCIPLMAVVK